MERALPGHYRSRFGLVLSVTLIFMGIYSRYLFPRVINFMMTGDNFVEQRRALLAKVSGETLEIGFGTGLNLPYYSKSLNQLTIVDVNPGMLERARGQIDASPIDVEAMVLNGESLPMPENTFDSVVSTWTLCSIPGVRRALSEILRVLKPDGRFFFIEHGLAEQPSLRRWQHRLTPFNKVIGDGCHLDRNMEALIHDAGFETLERFYMKKVPKLGGYQYRGIARPTVRH